MSTTDDTKNTSCQLKATEVVANLALMGQKKVIRIGVTSDAKAVIKRWADDNDMTEIGVASRIYQWFGQQPEDLQRGVLGLYGSRTPDVAKMALERLASTQGQPAEGEAGYREGKEDARRAAPAVRPVRRKGRA